MYFVYRNGRYHNVAGQSFRDFMAGRLPGLPGVVPSLKDWESHLTTVFPEASARACLLLYLPHIHHTFVFVSGVAAIGALLAA